MKIVVAGGSGFLGHALVRACRSDGHDVMVLTRNPRGEHDVPWSPESGTGAWVATIAQSDAVVNLAGEGIADRRWTAARKQAILASRVAATRALAQAVRGCDRPPHVMISASGVGFYGTEHEGPLTEDSPAGSDFLAAVCRAWEQEASEVAGVTRLVLLRTGLVLARDGGALPKMAAPFRLFVGGRIGSGRQYLSWIHRTDWVGMVQWALSNASLAGPLNVTAPSPVTNARFTRELAKAMRRPALFPVPPAALRLLVGREMADTMLLSGQQALPAKALQSGYRFSFPAIESALGDLWPV